MRLEFRFGAQTPSWRGHGAVMARSWRRHGAVMAPSWRGHGAVMAIDIAVELAAPAVRSYVAEGGKMANQVENVVRGQLMDRHQKLETALVKFSESGRLRQLLQDVDAALERLSAGSYGLCEVCHDPVEAERLIADPLARFCIDHLSPHQQQAL